MLSFEAFGMKMRDPIDYRNLAATALISTQIPTVITDPHQDDNPIVFVNGAFERLTGYQRHEIIGRNCCFLHGPETDQNAVSRIRDAIVDEIDIQVDLLNYRKDGSTFWSAFYLSPSHGKDSTVRFFIASQIDITDRVEAARMFSLEKAKVDAEIIRHTAALDELAVAKVTAENAVRQKADFVANMSHELRTPLTGVLGLHDLLQADPTLGPAQRRYLIMARDAGRALLNIVDDILDFSKIEAGELTIDHIPYNLLSIIEYCEDITAETVRVKDLTVEIFTQDPYLMLQGDANRLKQILLNLIGNAIKFTEKGGISIRTNFDKDLGLLRCEVSDTGIGVSKDQIPLLFKRFSQADTSITRRFGGTGLGLVICESLVKLMGGQIGVDSDFGVGSMFWFEIPAQEVEKSETTSGRANLGVIPPQRILLAEDNGVNQEIIKAMLETRGHDVTLVDNGAAAAVAARSNPPFDLILMDLHMPIMDGLSASRVIRSAERSDGRDAIPIIALTANAMAEDVKQCQDAGMDVHVAKPIEWAQLFAVMERLHVQGAVSQTVEAAAGALTAEQSVHMIENVQVE